MATTARGFCTGLIVMASCTTASAETGTDAPTNLYWGDTHLHTYLSADAYALGTRITPEVAYQFAQGKSITADNGRQVQLARPLDFLMVSDHAENLGVQPAVLAGKNVKLTKAGEAWKKIITANESSLRELVDAKTPEEEKLILTRLGKAKGNWKSLNDADDDFRRSIWEEVIAVAEKHNDPGTFTTFIGFEWTADPMIHRNVLFLDGAANTRQVVPFSRNDSGDPEDLWRYLAEYERKTGGRVLAIPHNANLSGGMMFTLRDQAGKAFTPEYAKTRARWEPVYEATQYKGDSEVHPALSPDDSFANFEKLGMTRVGANAAKTPAKSGGAGKSKSTASNAGQDPRVKAMAKGKAKDKSRAETAKGVAKTTVAKTKEAAPVSKSSKSARPGAVTVSGNPLESAYARPALKMGLDQQATLGVNPFKLGLIGSTDSHVGLSSVDEDGYLGKQGAMRATSAMWNAAGYAGVWATENTRQAIFDALQRREVYASTGPRMTVRVFGGWDFRARDARRTDLAQVGYGKGVPMGGDLTSAPRGKTPRLLLRATKDPDGANLDRIQVIKGWRDNGGTLQEKVYNVALSDRRKLDSAGDTTPVGNTVNLDTATYKNSIGASELSTVWTDPDFDPAELAFYYVRVLEIPTPRWTDYDVARLGTKLPPTIPVNIQERAYTSPIWYTP